MTAESPVLFYVRLNLLSFFITCSAALISTSADETRSQTESSRDDSIPKMILVCQGALCSDRELGTDVGKGADTPLRGWLRPELNCGGRLLHFFYVCGATRENLSHCLCYNPLNKLYNKIDGRLHIPPGAP